MKRLRLALIIIVWLVGTAAYAADLSSTHFIVRDPVVGTGGGYQASATYQMYSAGNLNLSGNAGSSTTYQERNGVLQYPSVTVGTLAASVSGSTTTLTWGASTGYNGYTVAGYNIGIATVSGGPYTFTSIGNVLTYSYANQTPGTYYYVLQTVDGSSNVLGTSNEATSTIQETISFALSANTISFGPLTSAGPRYATTSTGSGSVTSAHSITASSNASTGYTILYNGGSLTNGASTITPATISGSSTGSAGSNQFALSLLSTGIATVPTTYDQTSSNWNFAANTLATIASTSGPTAVATLNAYYLANVGTSATAGTYNTTITYEITANY